MNNQDSLKDYGSYPYETNPLVDGVKYHEVEREDIYFDEITSKDKVVLERLRMVTDSGFPKYDISYIYITFNGKPAQLFNFPTDQLWKKTWKKELIDICKENKIFIKDLVSSDKVSILR